ncbi:MAG: glycosyltransferase [bacterium]|nr:glycosyltransferase [bacterium]
MVLKTSPLVSIVCTTYNQIKYIKKAIDGFLMQQTDFPVEIVIHDDASTDGTDRIIREYAGKYPELIFPIFQTENQFARGNGLVAIKAFGAARGKYIALCEGDDYWTDRHKLQKQVDFLESNPDYSICFHRVKLAYPLNISNLIRRRRSKGSIKETTTITDLCRNNYIYTASCVFQNRLTGPLPQWFEQVLPLDWPYFVLAARHGKIKFIKKTMAVYRIHQAGIWGGTSAVKKWQREIEMLQHLGDFLNRSDCQTAVDEAIRERQEAIAKESSKKA